MTSSDGAGRSRVASLLSRRGQVRVLVIDTPSGHGRSELIRTALRNPVGGLRDVAVVGPSGPAAATEIARNLEIALIGATRRAGERCSTTPADIVRDAIAMSVAVEGPLCLVADGIHRAGDAAIDLFGQLARNLPFGAHLLLGGAGLDALGISEMLLDGVALRVGTEELALNSRVDECLLADALRADVAEPERRLLGCLLVLEQNRRDVANRMAEALGGAARVEALRRLPLVSVGDEVIVVDDLWRGVKFEVEANDLTATAAAAAEVQLRADDFEEAGRLATLARSGPALRSVVRAALSSQPPRVGMHTLRAWHESAVLPKNDPHAGWLEAATLALSGASPEDVIGRYEKARAAFAEQNDVDAEVATGLALGIVARRIDDFATLANLVGRSHRAAAEGEQRAVGVGLLGEALMAQMAGDPGGALDLLGRIPVGTFDGDWAAQVAMMRGTNLLLCGRFDQAIEQLADATGSGSTWSYATALQLLSIARWMSGDASGALADLEASEARARAAGMPVLGDHSLAVRCAMLAAVGDPEAADLIRRLASSRSLDDEAKRLLGVATVMCAVGDGDLEVARSLAESLPLPKRAVLSAHWVVSLIVALLPERIEFVRSTVQTHSSLQNAFEAGERARAFLDTGTLTPLCDRPYLPGAWCERGEPVVEVEMLGIARVRRDRRVVESRSWERTRVRELCLYLALVESDSRELAAERLWPELDSGAASRNLRVTLTHLLDVLDPDRVKGSGSGLLVDRQGVISLADTPQLRIDVRDELHDAKLVIDGVAADDQVTVLAAARRLVRHGGRLLGGVSVGAWIEDPERARSDAILGAVGAAGPMALRCGDPGLAESLARRGLQEDPWAERLHQLLARARLERGDLDGARRALRHGLAMLHSLGVQPERSTWRLVRELGLEATARQFSHSPIPK